MKVSISVYGANQLVPEERRTVANIIAQAAAVGFDGIDLGYYWGENRQAEFQQARKIADDCGIQIANYICGNNFGNALAEGRGEKEIANVKQAIEEAACFGCPALRIFAGGNNLAWEEYSPRIADAIAACLPHAEQHRVVLALEDHGGLCRDSAQMLYYLQKINSPFLKANIDIGNFWLPGNELPEDGVRATAPYAAMVHVKDYLIVNNTFVAVPTGEGLIDFATCFRTLSRAGYTGWLSLEYECKIGDPRQGITTSLVNIRRASAGC